MQSRVGQILVGSRRIRRDRIAKTKKRTMNRMTYRRLPVWLLTLLIPFSVATTPSHLGAQDEASTQMVRTLVIKNNEVVIDGRKVDASNLAGLVDLTNLSVSYSFVGVDIPVVTIGDQLFAVRENKLEPIESRTQNEDAFVERKRVERPQRDSKGWIVDFDRGEYYTFQGERLEIDEAVPRLLHDANNLYLEDLQKENQRLFSRLARERELENQAEYLARAARRAQTEEERTGHIEALTEKLNEIFELKQQNRLAEIEQFEAELEALKQRVEKREQLKEKIIESRVARLTGLQE